FALRHRSVHAAADILSGVCECFEIHMRRDVRQPWILQWIGESMTRDSLEGIPGVAANVAVVDDECHPAMVANSRGDLHCLTVWPPFEHRAEWRRAHRRRQQRFKPRDRHAACGEYQIAAGVDVDHAFVPTSLPLDCLMNR